MLSPAGIMMTVKIRGARFYCHLMNIAIIEEEEEEEEDEEEEEEEEEE